MNEFFKMTTFHLFISPTKNKKLKAIQNTRIRKWLRAIKPDWRILWPLSNSTVAAARKVSPHWSQKQHNIVYYYFHCFMVRATNQLAFRVMRVALLSQSGLTKRLLACSCVLSVSCSIGPNRYIFLDFDWFKRVYVVTGHRNVVGFRPLSTRIWTFLKPHIIFPGLVWRPTLHHSGEWLLKRYGFLES